METFVRNCITCQYRHSCNKPESEYDDITKDCLDYVPGKCFKCKVYVAGGSLAMDVHCNLAIDWEGCENFQEA